jgi:hypothetical protein
VVRGAGDMLIARDDTTEHDVVPSYGLDIAIGHSRDRSARHCRSPDHPRTSSGRMSGFRW